MLTSTGEGFVTSFGLRTIQVVLLEGAPLPPFRTGGERSIRPEPGSILCLRR
jgi:hypothetical protein